MSKQPLGKGLDALLPEKQKNKPHCGHPGRSKRLAQTLSAIKDAKKITTLQLHAITGSMKASTDIDDLRRAGYPISMAKYLFTTDSGRKVFEFEYLG